MVSQTLRRAFLDYFKKSGHTVVPSSPVAPHEDPTLLFVNAGMNQFKDVFLGQSQRDYKRATTTQKCIRVGGKHNDLENVGHTSRHLTFFEMLGNFSFGDYFKKEAIAFAWELTTTALGFDGDRIWASVFREDDEAFELWRSYLPEKRIVRLGERDNFWVMGETGPCGPCSELLYDRGEAFGSAASPYEDTEGERFIEFWNLVFMEFNRDASGRMGPLPRRCIDTGAGLERLVMVKQGAASLFETDILQALVRAVESHSSVKYERECSAPFHVIADHMRSLSFAIADGVQPSNVERGYVLRKILRRAVRYGRQIGFDRPFLADLLPTLLSHMGDDFPELKQSQARIAEILTLEEEGFFRTLRRGGNLLQQVVEQSAARNRQISGDDAFKLKDTYGLPLEEILLLAKDADLTVDLERYQSLEQEARARSRAVHKTAFQVAADTQLADYVARNGRCTFLGYEKTEGEGSVKAIFQEGVFKDVLEAGESAMVLLDQTPFYAEKGGQVGDTGLLEGQQASFRVVDCQEPYSGVIAHFGELERGSLRVGDNVSARVDAERRRRITHYHTATHLLHWALCRVLGMHVQQKGSVVAPDRLRFDFSHHKALSREEIRTLEDLVNEKIGCNKAVQTYEISYAEAQKRRDIKQFFGDKYGEHVRVVDLNFSTELCGGTHVHATGEIGYFRIIKEGSISAGVRRIEAVVGADAAAYVRGSEDLMTEMAELLKTSPQKLLARVSQLLEEHTQYAREMKAAKGELLASSVDELIGKAVRVGEVTFCSGEVVVAPKELGKLSEEVSRRLGSGVVALGAVEGGRCSLSIRVSQDLISRGIKASELIKSVAPLIGGSGGGRADVAQGGGTDPQGLVSVFQKLEELLT